MNKGRVNIHLVTRMHMEKSGPILRIIKGNHGGNPRIEIVRSSKMFDSKGLTTLMYSNRNRGFVYIIKDEFSEKAIKVVTETGIPFWIISKNNSRGGWTASCINGALVDKVPVSTVTEVATTSYAESQAPH